MPTTRHRTPADTTEAVEAFIRALDEPRRTETASLRAALLDSDPGIRDGVKWNAPSYRTHEYFATTHLRGKTGIALVLHFGAKARPVDAGRHSIDDPAQLLEWLAPDRAMVRFADAQDIASKRPALQALVRQWIRHV